MKSPLMLKRRRQHFIWLGAVVAVAVIPLIFGDGYSQTVILTIGLYAIFGIGLQMTMGTGGILNMGHAAFIGIGAYSSGIVTVNGGNAWVGMLVGIVASGALAFIVGLPILRLRSLYLAIATLCIALAIINITGFWTPVTGGQNGLFGIKPFAVGDFVFTELPSQIYLVWGFLLVAVMIRINLRYSVVGREFEAIKDSDLATSALGINHGARRLQIFVIGSVIGAVGGSLYSTYLSAITPDLFGFQLLIQIFVLVALGGMLSLWGAPIGAIAVVCLHEFLIPAISGGAPGPIELVIFGAILVVVMVFAPNGVTDQVVITGRQLLRLARRKRRPDVPAAPETTAVSPNAKKVAV
ncbi:branched-chain amino acid ABC transporter permease [Arthrobacter sp. AZCC_0090]|uniref:branched-chain amino acid ABC transporter permease n=1 Tax=Arthrobacter sp. AZCC_0090 TaxID=2735881 RepID=UPI00161C47F7|nr:branched-chain amino acid ABC transporter permease [Arthrobacter sp. AZCC_0090]MBB6406331.1 branched-chain amino acid transport system permease protein [Arthrobacter sp. AZCC_0090]